MSADLEYLSVPSELMALSARASEHWAVSSTKLAIGSVVGGAVQDFTNGCTQTQIASFAVPRLPVDDARDPADMQSANTELAVACVEWVRSLIARNEAAHIGVAGIPRVGVLATFADHADGIEAAYKSARGKHREEIAKGLNEYREACHSLASLFEAAAKAQDTNRDDFVLARPDVSHLPESERVLFLRGWDAASEAVFRTGLRAALARVGGAA